MGRVFRPPKVFTSSWQPPAPKRHQAGGLSWRFFLWGILLIGFAWLYFSPLLAVQEINISGDQDEATINQLKQLQSVPILSRRIGSLVHEIRSSSLALTDVSCRRGLPHTLNCQIEQRKAMAIWVVGTNRYLIDESGLIYADVTNTTVSDIGIEIDDLGNIPVKVGDFVLSRQIIGEYGRIVGDLTANNLTASKFILTDATLYQVDVLMLPAPKYSGTLAKTAQLTVKFNLTNSVENQLATLLAILQAHGAEITERIDLRVNGTVYYK